MTKKVTMLELFSGIGAQERALRQLNIPYEVIGTCDLDKDAVLSYAAMRYDFETEYKNYQFPTAEEMVEELQTKGVGYDFQKGKHSITSRTSIDKLKQYYLADKLSKNLGDISRLERMPYADLVTYSFPCTDLSVAGLGEGMTIKCEECNHSWPIDFSTLSTDIKCPNCGNTQIKSTRSGLLGEVQRLLDVSYKENTLPKYLLLENVKNLVGKKFKPQFDSWLKWLDSIGYNTYYQVLNAKHYGIPQNRERVFAISIRKDVDDGIFAFPQTIPLTTRLKDVLEKNVDEKYYLPDERIEKILHSSFVQERRRIQTTDVCETLLARDYKDPKCVPVEADIQVIGNYMPSNHDASRVVDIEGVAPTVKENHGTVTAIAEPFIVASRGRNPENPSDRTVGTPTEQRLEPNFSGTTNCLTSVQKDNYVVEPQVLRAERTEYGKAIRKQYEAGEIDEKIGNMRDMKPRTDGISNTITTVQKDNYVVEPKLVGGIGEKNFGKQYRQGNRVYDANAIAMALNAQPVGNTGGYSYLYAIEEPIVYDDYNSHISSDQTVINTLTTNCGASAERNGVKIIEPIIVDDMYANREPRLYTEAAPTLRSERTGLKVAESTQERFFKQAWETAENNECDVGDTIDAFNKKVNKTGISPTITTRPEGFKTAILPIVDGEPYIKWRIRKLTPKECWRLMCFDDMDCDRAAQYVSVSALYKQAGNSICTCCLVAIFNSLLLGDSSTSYVDKLVKYDELTIQN